MPKLNLTIIATVELDDFEPFYADQPLPADLADSFNARLNEVYGAGQEVLTSVRVEQVIVGGFAGQPFVESHL